MERDNAIALWNATARITHDITIETTHMGAAALAGDAPTIAFITKPGNGPLHKHNMRIVRFLREWANAIEGEETAQKTELKNFNFLLNHLCEVRIEQDEKWGGPEHDDMHSPQDWRIIINKELRKYGTEHDDFEDAMYQVAAVAIAALESLYRKERDKHQAPPPPSQDLDPGIMTNSGKSPRR